ncbi:MAG: sporulation protein YqfD [Clostridia bacterium]|nr:sporulation protein YqfD [Clostridia bacterium]
MGALGSGIKDFFYERFQERVMIEGIMPERALLRLKRAGIGVYKVKKIQKNQILFHVKKKDSEKVFAIFPNVCYNSNGYTPYTVRKMGAVGIGKTFERIKSRTGVIVGALLFCALTLFADNLILGVDFVGTDVYAREAIAVLEENGIKPFSVYRTGNEDLVCAKILSQKGVEFCSVKKSGLVAVVEVRLSPFAEKTLAAGDMRSTRTGTVLSVTALRGTPLKSKGDSVQAGELLVGGYFLTGSGEEKRVEVIARASVACVYETELAAESEEEAFAAAYLELGLLEKDEITNKTVVQTEDGAYAVKIEYTAIQTMNF